ncbi:hypothetical protein Tco_1251342 [Tanacetum coccineum]
MTNIDSIYASGWGKRLANSLNQDGTLLRKKMETCESVAKASIEWSKIISEASCEVPSLTGLTTVACCSTKWEWHILALSFRRSSTSP